MDEPAATHDLIVIGSGPAGGKAALHAALHGRRVVIIERSAVLGGAGVNTGTIPSKTLKETALHLSRLSNAGLFGVREQLDHQPDARDLYFRERYVVSREREQVSHQLLRRKVEIVRGTASFRDARHVTVATPNGPREFSAPFVLIATGSSPDHPAGVPFDGKVVHDSDTILHLDRIPRSLCIVGAGVIGCEYATMFAALGTQVTLVNSHAELLPFLDHAVVQLLLAEMQRAGVDPRCEVRVDQVEIDTEPHPTVRARLSDGSSLTAEMFLFAAGRIGNTAALGCERIGLTPSDRGTLPVNADYATSTPGVYAAGDVIGFPALGSTSMDQGRVAVTHMFGLHSVERIATAIPYGIYTIPEISMVGLTEAEAQRQGRDVASVRVDYADIPRGTILGVKQGFLKLVYDRCDRVVLGVHVIGPQATELIHYGMELVEDGKTLAHVTAEVFNYPTLHELYKEAAYAAWPDA